MHQIYLLLLGVALYRPTSGQFPIHWHAPFFSGGGYCSEAISFLSAMSQRNITIVISQHGDSFNENFVNGLTKYEKSLLEEKYHYSSTLKSEISICHSEPGAWHAPYPNYQTSICPGPDSVYRIGRTMFETDRIPDGWVSRLNYMDEIWVPTNFSRDIFLREGVEANKLVVIGEPVDTSFYRPLKSNTKKIPISLQSIPTGRFIFLFVGKWEDRKNVKLLLRAYFEEFTLNDPIVLILLTSAYHSTDDFEGEVKRFLSDENLHRSQHKTSNNMKEKEDVVDVDVEDEDEDEDPMMVILSGIPQKDMPSLYSMANIL
eukprot:gene11111-23221_t